MFGRVISPFSFMSVFISGLCQWWVCISQCYHNPVFLTPTHTHKLAVELLKLWDLFENICFYTVRFHLPLILLLERYLLWSSSELQELNFVLMRVQIVLIAWYLAALRKIVKIMRPLILARGVPEPVGNFSYVSYSPAQFSGVADY